MKLGLGHRLKFRRHAPMPVIVGVPRSGTTMLRLMIDAHSEIRIPPETGCLPMLAELHQRGSATVDEMLAAFTDLETWPDFDIDPAVLSAQFKSGDPAGAARSFYRICAARNGKKRWGDKTPSYTDHIEKICQMLPEARVVHIVRDGRDVAISMRGKRLSPGDEAGVLAQYWKDRIVLARAQAPQCRHYMELAYEDLVMDPESSLKRVCKFLDLSFEPAMLNNSLNARERLAEFKARIAPDGMVLMSEEDRHAHHNNSVRPPDPSLIGRWRTVLNPDEVAEYNAVAGDLLVELGYEL